MYRKKVKEKEEKIADLTNKLQALPARMNQLREQSEFQPALPTDPLDEAVMKVVGLRTIGQFLTVSLSLRMDEG